VGSEERANVPIAEAKQDLYVKMGARPDAMVRVRLDQPPIRRILARAADVPGFGWQAFTPAPLAHPVTAERDDTTGAVTIANGLLTVAVDPTDGTFAIDGITGFGRLVDGGDLGDSYNYSPPLNDSTVDTPDTVTVTLDEKGPVRATATVVAEYRWPDHVDGASQRRLGEHTVTVTTTVEVRADEKVVRVCSSFVNPARDHRLRVHLPLAHAADHSEAECAFGTVTRGLTAEGCVNEFGLPTFPSRRFVQAGGLTVVHEGVAEYELVDVHDGPDGTQLASTMAITLLRSTGMLSRLGMTYRPFPAGPTIPVAGLQLQGRPIEARYALAVGDVDPWALADDVLLPLEMVSAAGGGTRPPRGSALAIDGAQVSSVRRRAGQLEVRVFNPTAQTATVQMGERSGWQVDLRGRPTEPFEGSFELRPYGFTTVVVTGV
jgi:alpha-mannosidase